MKTGRTLAGRYRVGELLGSGSMGEVYAATDIDGSDLAIKFLHERYSKDAEMRERFQREAANARRIESPFVARVVAAGPIGKGLWIAYQRLFGETLEERLGRERALGARLGTLVFAHVLHGLAAAHDVGVVHRDIKPANVFLERGTKPTDVRACILDFGTSKCRGPETSVSFQSGTASQGLTGTADTLGTIRYMAPEQIGGSADVDARADLYAAAVVLYRMLTGALPLEGRSTATILVAKLNDPPRPVSTVTGVAWPGSVDAFFRRALARDPSGRPGSAAELVQAWRDLVARDRLPEPRTFDPAAMSEHDPDDFQNESGTAGGSTART